MPADHTMGNATPTGAGPHPHNEDHPDRPNMQHHATSGVLDHGAKYGVSNNIYFHEEFQEREAPTRARNLIAKPTIRQWIENGKLYREVSPREISRFELFFDLLYVAIIRQLAELAVEDPGGPAVARFILTFWPSWSIWEEARRYSNVSGTDDLLHRTWILVGMMCLFGYSVNASAIELHPGEAGEAASAAGETAAHLAKGMISSLFGRAAEAAGEAAGAAGEAAAESHHSPAVHCAAAFWLIIKLTRVLVLWYYAWALPKFRIPQFAQGTALLVPMCVYLPLVWVTNQRTQIILASIGIVVDLIRFDVLFYYIFGRLNEYRRYKHDKHLVAKGELSPEQATSFSKSPMAMVHMPDGMRLPAVNIEHSIERSSAFVVIVLGELVLNLLYTPHTGGEFGASHKYGKAVLGLMLGWAMNFIYTVAGESPFAYQHALRRSWLTGLLFTFLHWPLCASLLLASAAASAMVRSDDVDPALKWYWGAGCGFAIIFIVSIDMLHHRTFPWNTERIPRIFRWLIGMGAGLGLILFPLTHQHLSSISMMGIAVGVTWFVLAIYIYGLLPTKKARLELERREASHPPSSPHIVETDLHLHREGSRHTTLSRRSRARDDVEDEITIAANT